MIGAKVNVVSGWGERFAREVNRQVQNAVTEASAEGARVASAASMSRRRTGKMAEMDVLPTRATSTGWVGGFRSRAWYAGFQSHGTLGSRRRKLKASTLRRRETVSGQARLAKLGGSGGIPPLRFLERGATAARKHLIARLNRI